MERPTSNEESCPRCKSGKLKLLAGRIAGWPESGGYVDFFRCAACGEIEPRDVPHQPPGKRT